MTACYLIDRGAICAIGIGPAQCSASFRAGLSGYIQSPVVGRASEPLLLALVPESDLEPLAAELESKSLSDRERRMLRLGGAALRRSQFALRGTDPSVTRAALSDILSRLTARGVAVLLCGMLAPPNYGSDYATRFNAIYPELATSFRVPLYPFFLQGVAADAKLNQADGMHPTAEGVDVIVNNILPTGKAFVGSLARVHH